MTRWYLTGNDTGGARLLRTFLQEHHVEVSASWLDDQVEPGTRFTEIDAAQGLVLVSRLHGQRESHPHAEAGYAMGQRKPVVLYGSRDHHPLYHSSKVVLAVDHLEVLQSCLVLGNVMSQVAQMDLRGDRALADAYRVIDAWHAYNGELDDGHASVEEFGDVTLATLNELVGLLESRQVREAAA